MKIIHSLCVLALASFVSASVSLAASNDPAAPTIYRRGEIAEAEPAVPGWSMPVANLFPPEQ